MIGTLTIRVRDARTGRQLRVIQKRNTITFEAGDIVRAMLAQRATDPSPTEYKFGSMRFGTDNTTAIRSQTDLITEVIGLRKELTDGQKVDGISGEISLDATIESTEGNGNTFQEAGVFTIGSGTYDANVGGTVKMFSRQTHAPLAKTSAIAFDYTWTFQFTT
jgi:hypothetical protein